MAGMPPHDQPWLAFSRVRWRDGFERRLVRVFDDRIEVRAGRFAIETRTIPMADVYDVQVTDEGAVRIVAVPDDVVIAEGTDRDRALAADLVRKNAPPPRKKPKPKPKDKPEPQPKAKPAPSPPETPRPEAASPPVPTDDRIAEPSPPPTARPEVGIPEEPSRRRAVRALALLAVGTVVAAVAIVAVIGGTVFVIVRLVSG